MAALSDLTCMRFKEIPHLSGVRSIKDPGLAFKQALSQEEQQPS